MSTVNSSAPLAGERLLVWIVAFLSFATAVLYVLAGFRSGDWRFVVGALGPVLIGVLGVVSARVGRGHLLPVLLATSAVIVVENQMLLVEDFSNASFIPLAVIGVAGAFYVPTRWAVPYAAGYAVAMFSTRVPWAHNDTNLLQATIAAATVFVGALFSAWIRRGFDRRGARLRSLFQHAPVSMWQEDFSDVATEIERLQSQGIDDLESYLRSTPEAVRRLASLVEIKDVNEAAVRLTEAPDRSVLVGRFAMDTFSRGALESFIPQFMAVAENRESVTTELNGGLTVTGRNIEALIVWSAPQIDGAVDLTDVTVAIVDITHQRETERRLQSLVDSKDQLVATISHEIRTPLTAVVGIADELRNPRTTIDEAERAELLELMADQSLEVSRIVDDLLVIARSDAGNLVIEPRPLRLAEEAPSVVRSLDERIPVAIEGDPVVVADPQRVRQIIRNLVTNAQRYGGPRIRVVVKEQGSRSVVEVRDDGSALPAAGRTTMFEPYGRAEGRPVLASSVGLGLTVSRRLARHMGGDLTYDHDGHEAIFALTLSNASLPTPVS